MKDRTQYIGASDLAAICGISRFSSPYDVWLAKTANITREDNEAMKLGREIENVVLDVADKHEAIGPIVSRQPSFPVDCGFPLVCHPDGVNARMEPVEAKTSGLVGVSPFDWSEPPPEYRVQLLAQMYATKADIGHLIALVAGRGIVVFHIERDDVLLEAVLDEASRFWQCVIERRPPDAKPLDDTILRVRRAHREVVVVTDEAYGLVSRYMDVREERLKLEKEEEQLKKNIMALALDADRVRVRDYNVYYKMQQRRSVDVSLLRERFPFVYNDVLRTTESLRCDVRRIVQ